MRLFSTSFLRRQAGLLLVSAMAAMALPPGAPSDVKVQLSLGVNQGGARVTGDTYVMTWNDNAIDETGYKVELRGGNAGPFMTIGNFGPNLEGLYLGGGTTPPLALQPGQSVQFRVTAYKYNGAKIETRTGALQTVVYPSGTGAINTPTGLTAAVQGDGRVQLNWVDTSTGETYHQVFYKKQGEASYSKSFYLELDRTEVLLRSGQVPPSKLPHLLSGNLANSRVDFVPGTTYNFRVRSVLRLIAEQNNYHNGTPNRVTPYDSELSNEISVAIPELVPPTNLQASVLDQTRIRLRWTDNSENESGYRLEYKGPEETDWEQLGSGPVTTAANATQFDVTVGSATNMVWRVRAVYLDPVSGSEVSVSEPSDEVEIGTAFPGPGNLTATDTGYAGQILLEWQDQSEAETNFEVFARVKGTPDWKYALTLPADTRRVIVTRAEFTDGELTEMEKGTVHEFRVEAVIYTRNSSGIAIGRIAAQEAAEAEATPNHGFVTPWQNLFAEDPFSEDPNDKARLAEYGYSEDDIIIRPFHPVRQGEFFQYRLGTSNDEALLNWAVSGLPPGLEFDASNGLISGVPTAAGLFPSTLTATFNNNHTATAVLNLRVLPMGAVPEVANPIPDITYAPGLQLVLPLGDKFADADSQAAVRLRTTQGDLDILLYPELTPQSVQNFLHYVNNGTYNGVAFHRSVPGFIIQGGSYLPVQAPDYFVLNQASRPSPLNEPGISNVRGTLAWAKLPGAPDSATLDFFINLANNAYNLDNQNEGFSAFGRVAGNGMDVVDEIADLPIGVYRNFNTGSGTNASLDKRVQLFSYSDGQYQYLRRETLETMPMNSEGSAPVDMDVEKTVRILQATQIPVFKYSVTANSDSSVVSAVISGTNLVMQTLKEGSSTITVQATDLDGNVSSQSFTATIVRNYKAPAITRQPVSVTVLEGGTAKLTVKASGSGTLNYQWLKDGEELVGETQPTLVVTGVDTGKTGEYAVFVSSSGYGVFSNIVRIDLRAPPVFTTHPESKVVEVGQAFDLMVDGTGAPVPVLAWLRSGKVVPKQTALKYSVASATLADGGIYQARASNVAAKNVLSQPAEVLVVDKSSHLATGLAGKKVVLTAQAAGGPGLQYQWFRNGNLLLVENEALSGITQRQLTLHALSEAELGNYTCRVSSPAEGLEADTGAWRVHLAERPVLTPFSPPAAYIGLDYDYTLPFGGDDNTSVAQFTIKGLPVGLKMDPVTGRIQGRPTRPGFYPLTVTGRNPAGTSLPVNGTLTVLPMPEPAVGSFVGQVAASTELNGGKGGRFDMTVTDSGMVSGKLIEGKNTYRFTGNMVQIPGASFANGLAVITRRGQSSLALVFQTVALQGYTDSGDISGYVTDGVNSAELYGYRRIYHASWNPLGLQQTFNIGLHLGEDDVDEEDIPQGAGFLRATLASSGAVNCVGRMGDGTSFTCNSYLGSQLQFLVYQSLYKGSGAVGGIQSILGINLAPAGVQDLWLRVSGSLSWRRDPQAAAKERSYREGFGPLRLTSLGMSYYAPPTGEPVLGLPKGSSENARLTFSGGGLEEAETDPDVPVLTLNGSNVPNIPAAGNPGSVNLAVIRTTGLISGSFTLEDDPALKPQRKANFYGLVIPRIPDTQTLGRNELGDLIAIDVPGDTGKGVGNFQLAQKPSEGPPATTLKTSPVLSGGLLIEPSPIQILSQPLPHQVNPGEDHSFSVTAQALGNLSYQWRFNGTSISGATGSTYYLADIDEEDEGDYDVVITTAYGRIVSAPARLSVNDPVSSVIVSRSPDKTFYVEGETVTFSAAAVGSGDLQYQWRFNGDDISGANDSTYVIDAITYEHAGVYTVLVTSELSPDGVLSNESLLEVATMVSNPVATRTPADDLVPIGSTVIFSVTAEGTAPFQYQWYKDGEPIEGADQATYKIDFAGAGTEGLYSVLVSNSQTVDGVMSNEVPLALDSRVSNVVVTLTPPGPAIAIGQRVDFSVSNTGLGPFEYQWYKNGVAIEEATSVIFTLDEVLESDNGTYTVRVTNADTPEGVLSAPVELLVALPVTYAAAEITEPSEQPVTVGQRVVISVTADGTGPLIYQWFKDGEEIGGATSYELVFDPVSEEAAGSYGVRVSNAVTLEGVFSNEVNLEVQYP
jgi:cyclophilin family peptidyl-prolyl cis-trans isomerase